MVCSMQSTFKVQADGPRESGPHPTVVRPVVSKEVETIVAPGEEKPEQAALKRMDYVTTAMITTVMESFWPTRICVILQLA